MEGVAVVELARRELAPEVVGKAGWEFALAVAAEKAERALALAVAAKAGRGAHPNGEKIRGRT